MSPAATSKSSAKSPSGSTLAASPTRRSYEFGNYEIGQVRGPRFVNTDFSVFKRTQFGGAKSLELRLEIVQSVQPRAFRESERNVRQRAVRTDRQHALPVARDPAGSEVLVLRIDNANRQLPTPKREARNAGVKDVRIFPVLSISPEGSNVDSLGVGSWMLGVDDYSVFVSAFFGTSGAAKSGFGSPHR